MFAYIYPHYLCFKLNKYTFYVTHSITFTHLLICLIGTCIKTSHKSLSFGYMGSCFTLYFEPLSWSESFVKCKSKGSLLALIKSHKAINDISMKIKEVHRESVYYWIGLRRSQWYIKDKPGI